MYKILFSTFAIYGFLLFKVQAGQIPQPVEWENPLPKIADLKLDYKEIVNITGENGQFCFLRDPMPMTTWTKKEGVQTFPGGYVATNMQVVHAPLEKVRKVVKDYSIIEKIQSQHSNVKFVSQKDNHTLYSFDQVYRLGSVLKLKSGFLAQMTEENDGSISVILHEGDVDVQVLRWEFIALDKDRTVVVLSFWCAYTTAKFSFKLALSFIGIPESHITASVLFSTMYLKQYADYIEKGWLAKRALSSIYPNPVIPKYNKELSPQSKQLLESLVTKGTVYIRTYQSAMVQGKEMHDLMIITVFNDINLPVEQA